MSGKVLTMYLMDGDPIGRIKCKIANWTGIVYKIPRISIDNCDDIQELTQSGVYLLFGTDKDENTVVYIGQAGNRKNGRGLLQRICEPHNSIDYWSEVIILTTGDGSFGPTEISYLENRLFNMARKAGRYDVKNSNDPNPGNVTEEKECELEEFINYARIASVTLCGVEATPSATIPLSAANTTMRVFSMRLHTRSVIPASRTEISSSAPRLPGGFASLLCLSFAAAFAAESAGRMRESNAFSSVSFISSIHCIYFAYHELFAQKAVFNQPSNGRRGSPQAVRIDVITPACVTTAASPIWFFIISRMTRSSPSTTRAPKAFGSSAPSGTVFCALSIQLR